jgi:hypothetical protein
VYNKYCNRSSKNFLRPVNALPQAFKDAKHVPFRTAKIGDCRFREIRISEIDNREIGFYLTGTYLAGTYFRLSRKLHFPPSIFQKFFSQKMGLLEDNSVYRIIRWLRKESSAPNGHSLKKCASHQSNSHLYSVALPNYFQPLPKNPPFSEV